MKQTVGYVIMMEKTVDLACGVENDRLVRNLKTVMVVEDRRTANRIIQKSRRITGQDYYVYRAVKDVA